MRVLPQNEKTTRNAAVLLRTLGVAGLAIAGIMAVVGVGLHVAGRIADDVMPHTGPATWTGIHAAAAVAIVSLGTLLGVRTSIVLLDLGLLSGTVGLAALAAASTSSTAFLVLFAVLALLLALVCLVFLVSSIRAWPALGSIVVSGERWREQRRSVLVYAMSLAVVTAGSLALCRYVAPAPAPMLVALCMLTVVVEIGGGWIAARMNAHFRTRSETSAAANH